MFNQETWRRQIADQLGSFAHNPRQEVQLAGAPSLLSFLVMRLLAPFLEAFQSEPIAAVQTLAEITNSPGANQIVRRAARMRYQSGAQVERELRSSKEIRSTCEALLIELHMIPLVRQRLSGPREEWFCAALERELDAFPGEFTQLRRILGDPGWQARYEAIRALRNRQGRYGAGDIVLIHDGLNDSSAHVRAAAARMLGLIAGTPPPLLLKAIVRVALHDSDVETRYAAARAVGLLREHLAAPQILDYLSRCLFDGDRFVRSSAALVLGQLGELAGTPTLVQNLTHLLEDSDPYARETAARTLGQLGLPAATPYVISLLIKAIQDSDISVHDAAVDSLARLRELQMEFPLQRAKGA